MIPQKLSFIRHSDLLQYAKTNSFNQLLHFVHAKQQSNQFEIENQNEQQFMKGKIDKVIQRSLPWYEGRNVCLFGRKSASRTGELFYRTRPTMEHDPSLESGIFYQMFRDYCTPSLWYHKFATALNLVRDAMKHLNAQIKGVGADFMDTQMREAMKLQRKN
ncbi:hypothetical protein QQG55_1630 [Brugia pahangi]